MLWEGPPASGVPPPPPPPRQSHTGQNRYKREHTLPSEDTMVLRMRRPRILARIDQVYTPQADILCHQ